MIRERARDRPSWDAGEYARRVCGALRQVAAPVAACAGYALGYAGDGATDWAAEHTGCACAGGACESIPVEHRHCPAGTILVCARGGNPAFDSALRALVDIAVRQVEDQYDDEDLLAELGASWESLDTLYEVTADLQTSRNPLDVLARILDRIAARRPGLHAVLWTEREGVLEPIATRRALVEGPRDAGRGLIGRALRDRTTLVFQDGSRLPADGTVEPELLGAANIAIAPVATRERLVGALEVWEDADRQPFDSSSVRLFEALALQAGQVVESDRAYQSTLERERLKSEIEIGGRIQETLLWDRLPPRLQGAQIASFARASQLIDGDFCEFLPHGERCLDIVIGDVMGKGVPAALIGAAVKSELLRAIGRLTVSSLTRQRPEPRAVVAAVHEHLTGQLIGLDSFVSLSYNRFDFERHRLEFVGCGHPRTIHYRAWDGIVDLLEGRNLPIGVLEDEAYEQAAVAFEEGDLFLLYSDGVTEARSAEGEQFGEARLVAWLRAHVDLEPAALCAGVRDAVSAFTGTDRVSDDLTCVAVKVTRPDEVAPGFCWALDFTSELGSLPALRAWVRAACRAEAARSPQSLALLELAVTEVASNILRHAYDGVAGKPLRAVIEVTPGRAEITFTHWGRPFRPPPGPLTPPGTGEERGRGLFIITQAVDEIAYAEHGSGASSVRLVKRFGGKPEGGDSMLATFEREGDVVVVSVEDGVLDASNVKRFRQEVIPALESNTRMVLDLRAIEFIDSSGLGAILACYRQIRSNGGDLRLCGMAPPVRALFELVRMHRIFDTYPTREEAVASFGPAA